MSWLLAVWISLGFLLLCQATLYQTIQQHHVARPGRTDILTLGTCTLLSLLRLLFVTLRAWGFRVHRDAAGRGVRPSATARRGGDRRAGLGFARASLTKPKKKEMWNSSSCCWTDSAAHGEFRIFKTLFCFFFFLLLVGR